MFYFEFFPLQQPFMSAGTSAISKPTGVESQTRRIDTREPQDPLLTVERERKIAQNQIKFPIFMLIIVAKGSI